MSRPGNEISAICNSTILHSGTPSSHIHGVAVILSPRAKAAWEAAGCEFQPVSERILKLRPKCHMSYMTVVAVYAPTNLSNSTFKVASTSEAFYDHFQLTLFSVPSSDLLVIMGDFHARVGSDSWNSVIGPHGIGESNESGERTADYNQHLVSAQAPSPS